MTTGNVATNNPMAAASVRLEFSVLAEDGATLLLELDDARHRQLYGEARTRFFFGEEVFLRVFAWPRDMRLQFAVSDGTLRKEKSGEATFAELLLFSGGGEATLTYPALEGSLRILSWKGKALPGALACSGRNVVASVASGASQILPVAAVAEAQYRMAWESRRLTLPLPKAVPWPVVVAARGEVA